MNKNNNLQKNWNNNQNKVKQNINNYKKLFKIYIKH